MKILSAILLALTLFFLVTERQAMVILFGAFFGACQSIMIWKLPAFRETCRMLGIRVED